MRQLNWICLIGAHHFKFVAVSLPEFLQAIAGGISGQHALARFIQVVAHVVFRKNVRNTDSGINPPVLDLTAA
jgi:hypothetical protein